MNQEVMQWIDMANMDLIIYYGAQGGLPKIHALSMLLRQVCNQVSIEEKYYDYADVLTPYGTAVRYPNEIFLEEHHATTAIQYAEEIVHWVESIVTAA